MGQKDNEQLFYPYTKYENMYMQFSSKLCRRKNILVHHPYGKIRIISVPFEKDYVEPGWIFITATIEVPESFTQAHSLKGIYSISLMSKNQEISISSFLRGIFTKE